MFSCTRTLISAAWLATDAMLLRGGTADLSASIVLPGLCASGDCLQIRGDQEVDFRVRIVNFVF